MGHGRKVAVVGLGYVGLPVAVSMGMQSEVIGFDINQKRIEELQHGHDYTLEVEDALLQQSRVKYTSRLEELALADFYIIAVPTPIDKAKQPDLSPMVGASHTVGKVLKKGDIVVYESTVYPGVCEDICLPILEKESGLRGGVDFKIGYSPERINPGDKEHTFTKITKVVSAQDAQSLEIVSSVYRSVVTAGVYQASSIKVAEAAKVIENTQRDINIALMNELAMIFDKLGIDTQEVLAAAGTKWNFLKFTPGLVGGHCIGVDPYYLTYKAEQLGHHPQMILAGRKINDGVSKFIAEKTVKMLIANNHLVKGAKVAILGLTFKENCPDLRNSKVFAIIDELQEYGVEVIAHDPWIDPEELPAKYQNMVVDFKDISQVNAIILAVAHRQFREINSSIYQQHLVTNGVFVDVKGVFTATDFAAGDCNYWRL